jgi:hypothetical protein
MNGLIGGSEVLAGVSLLVATVVVVLFLRPREGLQERAIMRFPGAWIVVGLPLTFLVGTSIALIAVGTGVLR